MAKKPFKIFKADKGNLWGVCGKEGGLVYEAEFDKTAAQMISDIINEHPDWDWERTRDEMKNRGWVDPYRATDPGIKTKSTANRKVIEHPKRRRAATTNWKKYRKQSLKR